MTDVNSAGVAVPVDWRALLLVRGERWVESRTGLLAAVEYRSLWSLGDRRLAIAISVHPRSPAAGVLDRARVRLFSGTRWHSIVRLPEELLEVSVARSDLGHFRWQEGRLLWEALVVLGADPADLPPETRLAWLLYATEPGEPPVDPADESVPPAVRRAAPWTAPLEAVEPPANGDRPEGSAVRRDGRAASVRTLRQARPAGAATGTTRPEPRADEPARLEPPPVSSAARPHAAVPIEPEVANRRGSRRGSSPTSEPEPGAKPERGTRRSVRAQQAAARASAATQPPSVPARPAADIDPLPWRGTAPAGRRTGDDPRRVDGSGPDGGSVLGSLGEALDQARERVSGALERLELQREATRSFGSTPDGERPGPLWGPEAEGDAGPYDRDDGEQDDRRV